MISFHDYVTGGRKNNVEALTKTGISFCFWMMINRQLSF